MTHYSIYIYLYILLKREKFLVPRSVHPFLISDSPILFYVSISLSHIFPTLVSAIPLFVSVAFSSRFLCVIQFLCFCFIRRFWFFLLLFDSGFMLFGCACSSTLMGFLFLPFYIYSLALSLFLLSISIYTLNIYLIILLIKSGTFFSSMLFCTY